MCGLQKERPCGRIKGMSVPFHVHLCEGANKMAWIWTYRDCWREAPETQRNRATGQASAWLPNSCLSEKATRRGKASQVTSWTFPKEHKKWSRSRRVPQNTVKPGADGLYCQRVLRHFLKSCLVALMPKANLTPTVTNEMSSHRPPTLFSLYFSYYSHNKCLSLARDIRTSLALALILKSATA